MLTHDEELWEKHLPPAVEDLLSQAKDPLADRSDRCEGGGESRGDGSLCTNIACVRVIGPRSLFDALQCMYIHVHVCPCTDPWPSVSVHSIYTYYIYMYTVHVRLLLLALVSCRAT